MLKQAIDDLITAAENAAAVLDIAAKETDSHALATTLQVAAENLRLKLGKVK